MSLRLECTWTQLKALLDEKSLNCPFAEFNDRYVLLVTNGDFLISARILKTDPASSDQTEFEATYKDNNYRTLLC